MFFDLDHFKWINDSLGHPVGDRVLVQVAARLRRLVDEGHLVARFGGDEFTLLIDDATRATGVAVARQIESMLAHPFVLDGGEFFLSASIGLALNDHPTDAHGLVRDADAAMYAAKERGRARHAMFDEGLRERALTRLTLEAELRRALASDEFVMHYQPILDLRSRQWAGVEALVRWHHPERGTISPDQFIPLAEETGLIVALGLRILDKVVTEAAGWASPGSDLYFAANASVVQLSDPAFAFDVAALLARWRLRPDRLVLEVTESAVMQQLATAQAALKRITALGVRVVIDDFGTGYSSLARLGELPVTGIKIDKRFTKALGSEARTEKVVGAITDLAHAQDLQVVAEGLETETARAKAAERGCDFGQGYHLARPMPADQLRRFLALPL